MYSIMIVDDEPIIRKGITNFIQWDSINCKVTSEATNGLEAKELIQSNKPDIIISDIKMPGMDGIKLSKYIHENFPEIKVILLTGYSDFEYAQSAIRYNVVDFVLKPSSNNKITEAIESAIKIISKERLKSQKLELMKDKINNNLSLLQEKFLYDYIHEIIQNQTTIQNTMKELNINLTTYYILYFKFSSNTYNELIVLKENKKNILHEIKKLVFMTFKDLTHYNITMDCSSICTIINVKQNTFESSTEFILSKSQELLDFFSNFMNLSIYLGISSKHQNLDQIHIAYKEATESSSLRFYEDDNIFTYPECTATTSALNKTIEHNYVDKIIDSIKSGDSDIAIATMNTLILKLKSSRQPIKHIKNVGILISSLSFKLLINHYINLSGIVENSSRTYTDILDCDSISDLIDILKKVILSTVDRLYYLNSQDNYIIKKVTQYIELNYQNQIKLTDLAELAHVNSSYLSRLIKKETGSTLTEIIAKIRIEKAKDLLSFSSMKTYEIAIKVGIEDPAYFSLVFKKYTGLSPSEFRKHN
ncbi:response regulator transcription factor [Clostridium sp. DL1XJH146]